MHLIFSIGVGVGVAVLVSLQEHYTIVYDLMQDREIYNVSCCEKEC